MSAARVEEQAVVPMMPTRPHANTVLAALGPRSGPERRTSSTTYWFTLTTSMCTMSTPVQPGQ